MDITLVINPEAEQFTQIQKLLVEELAALGDEKLSFSTQTSPPPPGTLALAEVTQIVLKHPGEALLLVRTVLELVRSVLHRAGQKPEEKPPAVIIVVRDQNLQLPASSAKQKRFLEAVSKPAGRVSTKVPKLKTNKISKNR